MKNPHHVITRQRLVRASTFFVAMLSSMASMGDDSVWKCGNIYTDLPQEKPRHRCTELSTSVPDFRADWKSSGSDRRAVQPPPATASQSSRDKDARQILESELAAVTEKRNALRDSLQLRAVKSGGTQTADDIDAQTRAKELNRLDNDVESLQRELARLPAGKTVPAQRTAH